MEEEELMEEGDDEEMESEEDGSGEEEDEESRGESEEEMGDGGVQLEGGEDEDDEMNSDEENAEDEEDDKVKEDIYGRLVDSKGKLVSASGKGLHPWGFVCLFLWIFMVLLIIDFSCCYIFDFLWFPASLFPPFRKGVVYS